MEEWAELSDLERSVLLLAGEEAMLWEVAATLEAEPGRRGSRGVLNGQRVVGDLARRALLWFYRLDDGNPDLSETAVVDLFNQPENWLRDETTGTVASVCLYATTEGEKILGVR